MLAHRSSNAYLMSWENYPCVALQLEKKTLDRKLFDCQKAAEVGRGSGQLHPLGLTPLAGSFLVLLAGAFVGTLSLSSEFFAACTGKWTAVLHLLRSEES